MARRLLTVIAVSGSLFALGPAAFACGGLVAPGHAEVLQKATTLAAWHAGYEHYVTGFQFAGSASRFGYIVPLPGVPTRIEKAGNWTLERLERELNPPIFDALAAASPAPRAAVQVLQSVKIGALDIKVVRGGGPDVAAWAAANGFDLTPDAPNVLGEYSARGAVFALARFDRLTAAQQGLIQGQGQVIHFVIPMRAPWIPLRILALGKSPVELVDADLFILSDHPTTLSPSPGSVQGLSVVRAGPASGGLLADLRSDRGMGWLPAHGMWFTALKLHARAGSIGYDLSIDGGSPIAPVPSVAGRHSPVWAWWVGPLALASLAGALILRRGRGGRLSPA